MGSVVISLDAELGWGYLDFDDPPARVESARSGWQTLVDLFEEFDIPATWAVVGHLFLDDCDGHHSTHPAPDGWFAKETGLWRSRPDLRFGRDLIDAVHTSRVGHEIGCHSYSHPQFGNIDRAFADAEIAACIEVARDYGIELTSFVYPRNDVGHRDVLATHGFTNYRGPSPVFRESILPKGVQTLVGGVYTSGGSLLVSPTVDRYGLVDIPASLYLFSFEGIALEIANHLAGDPIVRQAKRGIDQAVKGDGVFHMWLHPNNLDTEYSVERIRTILAYLAAVREQTGLTVETMGDVAAKTRARQSPRPA
ncbi:MULTISPECIES: polysaccharide deacetylase family protein [Haloferax]|uniref:Polysaccharide deacetylase family protein n=2 Tax=Haloferax TaxID=2251 RepID=A0A6G1Z741_9EURY|nr:MULTISPECIES: polysaccharide deacetylase family protein [Haloferax]KAB1185118.1 polysaccharide deacetylase family protein [Haloferax sp. CBA1149]MRW82295.1 polysaccharide deacetylase family protein [Haloferax marinisediminis]